MNQPEPSPPIPDDAALLDSVLRIHPDDLVDFANTFFAAMDALHGPGGARASMPADGPQS